MWWLQKASINKSLILWFTMATSQKDPSSPCRSWVFCCTPVRMHLALGSIHSLKSDVAEGRCARAALTLWDFLFVTGCWCQARVQLWPDAVLTERWSSIVARQSLFSPHRSERTAGCTTAGNPLCDYNTQTLPVCTCFSALNPETDQIKHQQRPKPPGWCHVSEASVRLRL